MNRITRSNIGHGEPMITVCDDGIYFNQSSCRMFKLEFGTMLVFINDERDWQFFKSPDTDGFNLVRRNKKNSGLDLMSRPLVRMLCKSLKTSIGKHLKIEQLKNGYGRIIP